MSIKMSDLKYQIELLKYTIIINEFNEKNKKLIKYDNKEPIWAKIIPYNSKLSNPLFFQNNHKFKAHNMYKIYIKSSAVNIQDINCLEAISWNQKTLYVVHKPNMQKGFFVFLVAEV